MGMKKVEKRTTTNVKVEKALLENFVALQKVLTNLSVKFDGLTDRIDKLLDLFEISAKNLAKKDFDFENTIKIDNKEVVEKLDELSDQNRIIARGLTMLHENKARPGSSPNVRPSAPPQKFKVLPKF